MPAFLVPIHEFNKCHNPEGAGGGQFCSDQKAQLVRPGEAFDLVGAAKGQTLRFLFNPVSREMVVGPFSTGSHAEIFDVVKPGRPLEYDRFYVHGWTRMDADDPALVVIVDRVIPPPGKFAEDAVAELASRLVSLGVPPTAEWSTGFGPKVFGDEFPQLFRKKRRAG